MSIYSIPATEPFASRLAAFCENMATEENLPLSAFKIYLPTRRGIRTLQEAFLNLSEGKPRLLPIMQSIGDADLEEAGFADPNHADISPAIDPMRRQMVLARLLERAWPHDYNYQQALNIAAELGQLIDQIHTEDLKAESLLDLIEENDFAEHWKITTNFLLLVLNDLWPNYLDAEGMIDPGLHRRLRIEKLTTYYENNPPATPVIVAGSTGSIPATRNFIRTVAQLDTGLAILPALDKQMDEMSWHKLEAGHPQFLLKILLDYCKTKREDVTELTLQSEHPARLTLATEMMRPSLTSQHWQELSLGQDKKTIEKGVQGLTICYAESDHQEATVIALSMLEIAADPDQIKTATLITPDRYLAMRVQAILRQWGIDIDDSGGTSITNTAIGQYCLSVLNAYQNNQILPVPFLACIKNPYAGGKDFTNFRNTVRTLETRVFRGVRPYGDFRELANAHEKHAQPFQLFADIFAPLNAYQTGDHPLQNLITAHLQVMENLAEIKDMAGAERLWKGDDGEALAGFFSSLQMHTDVTPSMTLSEYSEMVEGFLSKQTFTATYGKHPRLSILGQIEARMVQADRVILSGLNEGIWPPDAGFDTWMSKRMRSAFGLPSLEQKTTLAAHDFMTAFCAPEVFITRSKKSSGQPTLPSRWLERLQTVLKAADIPYKDWPHADGLTYAGWADKLIEADDYTPINRPAPKPSIDRRPKEFSVTEIEKWMQDPYWIYAKKILGLRSLDPVDMEVGAADRGTLIHDTMEKFTKTHPKDLPANAYDDLITLGKTVFQEQSQNPEIQGFWWPRFTKAARWFINHEQGWRTGTAAILSEAQGYMTFTIADHAFSLKGKADRIESRQDGSYAIIDYKTGAPPEPKEVKAGLSSQLPLEALILQNGGFDKINYRPEAAISLYYWSLSGSGEGGTAKPAQGTAKNAPETNQLMEEALDGLQSLLYAFHKDDVAYIGSPDPTRMIKIDYNDYAHLERISEWSVTGDEGEVA